MRKFVECEGFVIFFLFFLFSMILCSTVPPACCVRIVAVQAGGVFFYCTMTVLLPIIYTPGLVIFSILRPERSYFASLTE